MPVPTPTRRTAALSVAALGALAVLTATAAPAHAGSVTVADAAGDVVDGRFGTAVRDNADILTTTLDHRRARVVMRFAMADVEATVVPRVKGRLRTPPGATFSVVLERTSDQRKTVSLVKDGQDTPRACDGLRGSLLPAKDQIVLSVPRSCLSNPRSVRFGALVMTSPSGYPVNHYDDARLTHGVNPTDYETPIGSREVRRGWVS